MFSWRKVTEFSAEVSGQLVTPNPTLSLLRVKLRRAAFPLTLVHQVSRRWSPDLRTSQGKLPSRITRDQIVTKVHPCQGTLNAEAMLFGPSPRGLIWIRDIPEEILTRVRPQYRLDEAQPSFRAIRDHGSKVTR